MKQPFPSHIHVPVLTLIMRQPGTTFHKHLKKINILDFGDYIWNYVEKLIPISTNMPSIGLVIGEIGWEY